MKKYLLGCFFLVASTLSLAGEKKCVPIDVPNPATQKACPEGFKGLQFKRTIVTCPDGKVKESDDFDKSQCVPIGGSQVDKCKINPSLCMEKPSPLGCPPGKHWTLEGLPYAHCVSDDPICPWGTTLVRNSIGEPSCKPNTCPSNKVLQGDGITCACPASTPYWDGAKCTSPPCANYTTETTQACPNNMPGSIVIRDTYNCNNSLVSSVELSNTCRNVLCPPPQVVYDPCPNGQTGQVVTTQSYTVENGRCVPNIIKDTSRCTNSTVNCPSDTVQYSACPAGQTGQVRAVTTYTGQWCSPSTTYDSSGCANIIQPQPTNCPATSIQYGTCPNGQSGQTRITTTYSGASCTPNTSTDTSNCIANCQSSTSTETSMCDSGFKGTKSRVVSVNSCTGTTYGSWDISGCLPDAPTQSCQPDGDWTGTFTQNYYDGRKILTGVTFVGCSGAEIVGREGDTTLLNCGYIWNGGGMEYPEIPTGKYPPGVISTGSKLSRCTNGSWTR